MTWQDFKQKHFFRAISSNVCDTSAQPSVMHLADSFKSWDTEGVQPFLSSAF